MTQFHYAHASGADWQAAVDSSLQALGTEGRRGSLGFCYLTDAVGGDAEALLDRLRAETDIAHWVGTVGAGVCSDGVEYFDTPAAAVVTMDIPERSFRILAETGSAPGDLDADLKAWIEAAGPCFGIVHGDPRNPNLEGLIADLTSRIGGGFLVGGLSSARSEHFQIADQVIQGGLSGVCFESGVAVSTRLTQGCSPIGPRHAITRADRNVIFGLDGRPALEVFNEDLAALDGVSAEELAGYVYVALPVVGSDTGDYLVRNLIGFDPDSNAIAIGDVIDDAASIMFCKRDAASAEADLLRMLGEIKRNLRAPPRGGMYFSCIARGPNLFGPGSRELKLIQQELGSLPLGGFFGNGEISNDRLYGYTGVLTLFL
jgi:small ligand-binding sensory domain FIST